MDLSVVFVNVKMVSYLWLYDICYDHDDNALRVYTEQLWKQLTQLSTLGSGWKQCRSWRYCQWDPTSRHTTGGLHSIMPTWENMRYTTFHILRQLDITFGQF